MNTFIFFVLSVCAPATCTALRISECASVGPRGEMSRLSKRRTHCKDFPPASHSIGKKCVEVSVSWFHTTTSMLSIDGFRQTTNNFLSLSFLKEKDILIHQFGAPRPGCPGPLDSAPAIDPDPSLGTLAQNFMENSNSGSVRFGLPTIDLITVVSSFLIIFEKCISTGN